MKLKKIASLMLAGIMAVSMLAACNDGNTVEEPDSSSSQVTTISNIANFANGAMSNDAKAICTFESNSSLAAAVKAVAEDSGKITSTILSNATKADGWDESFVAWQGNVDGNKLSKNVVDELDFSGDIYSKAGWNTWNNAVPASNTDVDYYVEACVLSPDMSEKAVGAAVAEKWNNLIEAFEDDVDNKITSYKAYVEAVKVYNTLDTSADAWVVAVMFEKTLAGTENVVA